MSYINNDDEFWKDVLNDNETINKETSRNKNIKLYNNKFISTLKTSDNTKDKFFSIKNYNNNIKKKYKNNNKNNSSIKRNNNSNISKFKSQNNLTTTELREKESLLKCTFTPKLNIITDKQLKLKMKNYLNKSIYDRNREYLKITKDNLLIKECNEQYKFYEKYKFKPQINIKKIIFNKQIINKLKNDRNINLYYIRMNSAREIKAINESENITDRDSMYFNNDTNYIINYKNKNRSISQKSTQKYINFLHNILMDINLDNDNDANNENNNNNIYNVNDENVNIKNKNKNKNKNFENIDEDNQINGYYYENK